MQCTGAWADFPSSSSAALSVRTSRPRNKIQGHRIPEDTDSRVPAEYRPAYEKARWGPVTSGSCASGSCVKHCQCRAIERVPAMTRAAPSSHPCSLVRAVPPLPGCSRPAGSGRMSHQLRAPGTRVSTFISRSVPDCTQQDTCRISVLWTRPWRPGSQCSELRLACACTLTLSYPSLDASAPSQARRVLAWKFVAVCGPRPWCSTAGLASSCP